MKKILFIVISIILSFLFFSFFSNANSTLDADIFYVSLSGNNDNNGDLSHPFRTIKYGVSLLEAGDTLIINPGEYLGEFDINVLNSGTEGAPITIKAITPNTVTLKGNRGIGEIDGGGKGIILDEISYIIIDNLNFENYDEGLILDGFISRGNRGHNIIVKHSTFKNCGGVGITIWKTDNVTVDDCRFISEEPEGGFPANPDDWDAVQDYGVAIYFSKDTIVRNSYFYGAHNQALSFKEGCRRGLVERNIFEGALYTAIYLGQNKRSDGRKISKYIKVINNIVRGTQGYRVKSPIRLDNVKGARVTGNYIEGFDETNNTAGIHIFSEVLGNIKINKNIITFGINNNNSGGINISDNISDNTKIVMKKNTFYDIIQDIFTAIRAKNTFLRNISYECAYFHGNTPENYQGDPDFINGDPVKQAVSTGPTYYDFDNYYNQLTSPFQLEGGSPARHFGAK